MIRKCHQITIIYHTFKFIFEFRILLSVFRVGAAVLLKNKQKIYGTGSKHVVKKLMMDASTTEA